MTTQSLSSVLLTSQSAILRDALPSDLESYQRWMQTGEWQEYDAPWERDPGEENREDVERVFRKNFVDVLPDPRCRLIVATSDNRAIGWVIGGADKRFPTSLSVGIDICEDAYLNRGIGTDALRLWVDYLFRKSEAHRIAFATYSFNHRVIRIAEKLGFTLDGRDREIVQWQGRWLDRLHFSMLRSEWVRGDLLRKPKLSDK